MSSPVAVFLKQELSGWKRWEVIYVASATLAIAVISIVLGDSVLGIASAVTGTLYTMFAGKGKVSCYLFGIFNTVSYGWIAFSCTIYGDAMLNWGIYLPMMFVGLYLWKRRLDQDYCVIKTGLSPVWRLVIVVLNLGGIFLYALLLKNLGDRQPFIDSATTVLSVTAMTLTLFRCIEQWVLWSMVNLLSVIMWFRVFITTGGESVATLLWWLIMLVSGIIFFFQWRRSLHCR